MYIERLKSIRATLQSSTFFRTHEVIGSSLLFVHDHRHASIWLIDFAKTVTLPSRTEITHRDEWQVGNHEDGYLIGIDNLISIFSDLLTMSSSTPSSPVSEISEDMMSEALKSEEIPVEDTVTQIQQLSIGENETSAKNEVE